MGGKASDAAMGWFSTKFGHVVNVLAEPSSRLFLVQFAKASVAQAALEFALDALKDVPKTQPVSNEVLPFIPERLPSGQTLPKALKVGFIGAWDEDLVPVDPANKLKLDSIKTYLSQAAGHRAAVDQVRMQAVLVERRLATARDLLTRAEAAGSRRCKELGALVKRYIEVLTEINDVVIPSATDRAAALDALAASETDSAPADVKAELSRDRVRAAEELATYRFVRAWRLPDDWDNGHLAIKSFTSALTQIRAQLQRPAIAGPLVKQVTFVATGDSDDAARTQDFLLVECADKQVAVDLASHYGVYGDCPTVLLGYNREAALRPRAGMVFKAETPVASAQ
jgi:hypothetical protein